MQSRRCSSATAALLITAGLLALTGCFPGADWAPPPSTRRPAGGADNAIFDFDQLAATQAGATLQPPALPPERPSGNVMVVIESIVHTRGREDLAAAAWRLRSGSVTAGSSPIIRRNGINLAVGGRDFAARFQAAQSRFKSTKTTRQAITVLDGREGSFFVGQQVPVARLVYWTPRGVRALFESATVGRSLVVRPVILPDGSIDLTVTPQFSSVGPRGRSIRVRDLSTRVVVRHGQPLLLGAMQQGANDLANVLFATGSRDVNKTLTIVVTPYLL